VQVRHAGIKARNSDNEKREEKPRLADLLLATAQTIFGKVKIRSFVQLGYPKLVRSGRKCFTKCRFYYV
jgi:hypothetical protein